LRSNIDRDEWRGEHLLMKTSGLQEKPSSLAGIWHIDSDM